VKRAASLAALTGMACAATFAALAQTAPPSSAGDAATGEHLFMDRCAMCHVAAGGGQGPSLEGLYGRNAGSVSGFPYSAALKASGLTWTSQTLDRFLADPGAMVPGTAMPIKVPDARMRADLIAYFAAQH